MCMQFCVFEFISYSQKTDLSNTLLIPKHTPILMHYFYSD